MTVTSSGTLNVFPGHSATSITLSSDDGHDGFGYLADISLPAGKVTGTLTYTTWAILKNTYSVSIYRDMGNLQLRFYDKVGNGTASFVGVFPTSLERSVTSDPVKGSFSLSLSSRSTKGGTGSESFEDGDWGGMDEPDTFV